MKLLATNSATYLRRLAREINTAAWKHGAYCQGVKLSGASYRTDTNIDSPTYGAGRLFLIGIGGQFVTFEQSAIFDGYGRHIVASREI